MRARSAAFPFLFGALAVAAGAVACSGAGGSAPGDDGRRVVPPPFVVGLQDRSPAPPAGPQAAGADQFFPDPGGLAAEPSEGCGPNLTGILRDFHDSHPDFGDAVADDRGLVQARLGDDHKPVYAPAGKTVTTSGAANFNQWYRDTPGVNQSMPFTLMFRNNGNGVWTYDNQQFFPLDGQLFGNEYQDHNYLFTFELHTEFAYRGGEVFTFAGDDDLWVFIAGQLAIDLGGVHSAETDQVDLDKEAQKWGLQVGATYPLDLFQAERHPSGSTFRVDTSLRFTACGTLILR